MQMTIVDADESEKANQRGVTSVSTIAGTGEREGFDLSK